MTLVWSPGYAPVDEHYDNVSLLLYGDGTNGSTTITDSSPTPKTVTANNGAAISTAQSKFGGASILFNGTSNNLTTPNNSAFQFGTQNFTVETWVRFGALTSNRVFVDKYQGADGTSAWQFYWRSTGATPSGGSLAFFANNAVALQDPSPTRIVVNTWYHVAVSRSGSTAKMFVDGIEVASATLSTNLDNNIGVAIGNQQSTSTNYFNGYIDDLRITKGVARYTANFTPPTESFPDLSPTGRLAIP